MKTIYTLLLACGLCLISHAQNNLQVLNGSSNIMSNEQYEELQQLLHGNYHTLILNDEVMSVNEDAGNVKRIQIMDENSLTLLQNSSLNLGEVQVLEFNNIKDHMFYAPSELYQLIPNLKYIYITSYYALNESDTITSIQNVTNQFSDVKIIFELLVNR